MTKAGNGMMGKSPKRSAISTEIGHEIVEIVRAVTKQEVLPRYRRLGDDAIQSKSSFSDLVTIADQMAEKHLTSRMKKLLPGFEIVGEEAVAADPSRLQLISDAESVIIIDPIDGTWNYAKGLPLFGVIIAVVEHGRTTFGVLYDPVSDDWITAHEGKGAFYGAADGARTKVQVKSEKNFSRMTGFLPLFLLSKQDQIKIATEISEFDRITSLRCSCHEYRLLSEGGVTFGLSGLLKPWDHAAGELIHREAGGYSALLKSGLPYSPDKSEDQLLLAPDRDTWDKLHDKFAHLIS